jgi:proline iminopeptidase
MNMTILYPPIQPYETLMLPVGQGHMLYVEACGNPQGIPVVFLHGGPGGGFSETHRRLFDPETYHIILFDQRGAGKSTPHASLEENTTWWLIEDMEAIRQHFGINQWLVFGGSWGSTLALAYAIQHPNYVLGLILRGIFLCRPSEIQWFYQEGCSRIFPDRWEDYLAPIPHEERRNLVEAYYKRLTHVDEYIRLEAAKAWSTWEGSTVKLVPDSNVIASFDEASKALAIARIECHYFINNCFFPTDNYLLENAHKLKDILTWIIHGRYDVVCPVENAWDLKKAMPHAQLTICPTSGHAFDEAEILDALIQASKDFAQAHQKSNQKAY